MIGYYVSVKDAGKTGLLLGPYLTHEEALQNIKRGRELACKADARAWFYAFGTVKIEKEILPKSVFGS